MRISVYELLEQADKIEDINQRVNFMVSKFTPIEINLIKLSYDNRIVWLLPPGKPPYKPSNLPDQHNRLRQEYRKLNRFLEGSQPLKQHIRENLFIQILETLDAKDAELLISIKDKKLLFKNLSLKVMKKAFPNYFN